MTEENFKRLLAKGDFQHALSSDAALEETFRNYRDLALSVDPRQVVGVESWYGVTYMAEADGRGITLTVMDFESQDAAQGQFEEVAAGVTGSAELNLMANPVGDASVEFTDDDNGIGPLIVFRKNDKLVQFHSSQPLGGEPLIDAENIESLARQVDEKLK